MNLFVGLSFERVIVVCFFIFEVIFFIYCLEFVIFVEIRIK